MTAVRKPETETEELAKLEWLRAAMQEAFDEMDRGEGIEFGSVDDLAAYIDQIGEEIIRDHARRATAGRE